MPKTYTIWLTGLPSAGKTTIAKGLHSLFVLNNLTSVLIDGDEFRRHFCSDLGFSISDRRENIRRAASMARMVNNSDVHSITSFISPTQAIRGFAKDIIGENNFLEVWVNAPLSVCKQRDVKGLYKKAEMGIIKDLTGVGSPYEPPANPFCIVNTSTISPQKAVDYLFEQLKQRVL